MSDLENLVKLQELTSAAVEISQEIEVADVHAQKAQEAVEELRRQLAEIKKAIAGLAAATIEADFDSLVLEKE